MCVCIYIYIYLCTYTYIHIHIYVYTYIDGEICIYTSVRVCIMCIYMHEEDTTSRLHVMLPLWVEFCGVGGVGACTHIHMYMYIYIYMYMYI